MGIAAEWGARVATGYQVPVLVERSRRLRSETRLRYDQLGVRSTGSPQTEAQPQATPRDRGHDTVGDVRSIAVTLMDGRTYQRFQAAAMHSN